MKSTRAYFKCASIIIIFMVVMAHSSFLLAQCTDNDGDGFYYEADCGTSRDCNDLDASTHPDATENCDGRDNDCDGSIDEGCDTTCDYPEKYGVDERLTNNDNYNYMFSSLVWTGSEYGISWISGWDSWSNYLYFARLDSSGAMIGSEVQLAYHDITWDYGPSLVCAICSRHRKYLCRETIAERSHQPGEARRNGGGGWLSTGGI